MYFLLWKTQTFIFPKYLTEKQFAIINFIPIIILTLYLIFLSSLSRFIENKKKSLLYSDNIYIANKQKSTIFLKISMFFSVFSSMVLSILCFFVIECITTINITATATVGFPESVQTNTTFIINTNLTYELTNAQNESTINSEDITSTSNESDESTQPDSNAMNLFERKDAFISLIYYIFFIIFYYTSTIFITGLFFSYGYLHDLTKYNFIDSSKDITTGYLIGQDNDFYVVKKLTGISTFIKKDIITEINTSSLANSSKLIL